MFIFQLDYQDLQQNQSWQSSRWVFGSSFVVPYTHPALEFFWVQSLDGKRTIIWGREKDQSNPSSRTEDSFKSPIITDHHTCNDIIEAAKTWPSNYILLHFMADARQVEIYRGSYASIDFFVSQEGSVLCGHWDPLPLVKQLKQRSLDENFTACFISNNWEYGSPTFIKEIKCLPAGSRCLADEKGYKIDQPKQHPYIQPKLLKEDIDVIKTYDQILCDVLSRSLPVQQQKIAVEVSGGLDSSNVLMALRKIYQEEIHSFAILLPNEAGKQQRERRNELISQVKSIEHTFEGSDELPCSKDNLVTLWPLEELYAEMLEVEVSLISAYDCRVVLSGIGGDELTLLAKEEMDATTIKKQPLNYDPQTSILADRFLNVIPEETWPEMIVSSSGLRAMAVGARAFLRKGIWPIHPLCAHELIYFVRSLPKEWRAERKISREYLAQNGLSKDFCYPKLKENFSELFLMAAPHIISRAQSMIDKSELIKRGIVNANKIRQAINDPATFENKKLTQQILSFIRVESMLRL